MIVRTREHEADARWSVDDRGAHDVATRFCDGIERNPTAPLARILGYIRLAYSSEGREDTYAAYWHSGDPLSPPPPGVGVDPPVDMGRGGPPDRPPKATDDAGHGPA